jgi:hypothetical protein
MSLAPLPGHHSHRNPAASAATPRGAWLKAVFQGEAAGPARQWKVVVVVHVAVAGDSGRADRGDELDDVGWQTKNVGRPWGSLGGTIYAFRPPRRCAVAPGRAANRRVPADSERLGPKACARAKPGESQYVTGTTPGHHSRRADANLNMSLAPLPRAPLPRGRISICHWHHSRRGTTPAGANLNMSLAPLPGHHSRAPLPAPLPRAVRRGTHHGISRSLEPEADTLAVSDQRSSPFQDAPSARNLGQATRACTHAQPQALPPGGHPPQGVVPPQPPPPPNPPCASRRLRSDRELARLKVLAGGVLVPRALPPTESRSGPGPAARLRRGRAGETASRRPASGPGRSRSKPRCRRRSRLGRRLCPLAPGPDRPHGRPRSPVRVRPSARAPEIDSEVKVPGQALQLIDATASNQLGQGQHDGVGLGLEAEEALRLVQKRRGEIERRAHTNEVDSCACGCQSRPAFCGGVLYPKNHGRTAKPRGGSIGRRRGWCCRAARSTSADRRPCRATPSCPTSPRRAAGDPRSR